MNSFVVVFSGLDRQRMDVMVGPSFSIDVPSSPPFTGNRPTGNVFFSGDSSGSSSSIGTPDDSDIENENVSPKRNREDDEEVQSKFKGLNSLDSLEDSLPTKLVPLFILLINFFLLICLI